ncbi:flagellar assembly protein FliW [Ureibacillus sp. GCM10028918]|uniref:flagellar assembly protein FliW n=1 Tax=Ureibacillus sp. GCM10028918 TaxID=3273429 RepID=UPI00361A0C13
MIIETDYLGKIEIDPCNIIKFEHGIPGFEEEKEFILLSIDEQSAFQMLQSVNNHTLAFVVIDPAYIILDYSFNLEESIVHSLEIQEEQEVAVYSIVSLKDTIPNSTINLKAPIIINKTNNKAKQVILDKEEYTTRHRIGTERGV